MEPGHPSDPRLPPHPDEVPTAYPPQEPDPLAPAPGPRLGALPRVALYVLACGLSCVGSQLFAFAAVALWRVAKGENPLAGIGGVAGGLESNVAGIAASSYVGLVVTLAVTAAFVIGVDRRPLASLGFERVRGWGLHWLAGLGIEGIHLSLIFGIGLAAGWYQVQSAAAPGEATGILALWFLVLLPAAATEEIVIRGYVLQTLEEKVGTTWAVVVSSALFAALHLLNPGASQSWMPMIGLFLAGVYLAVPYLATRQLWLPISMHVTWNLFLGPLFGLPVSGLPIENTVLRVKSGGPTLWTGGKFGPEAGLLVVITTICFSYVVWHLARRLPGATPRIR